MRTFDGPDYTILVELTPGEADTLNEAIKAALGARPLFGEEEAQRLVALWTEWPLALARVMQGPAPKPQA